MRVLVTGGGGFLGLALCRALVARGDEVRSLARGDYPALAALDVDARRGDVAEAAAVMKAAEGCDAVCHVAAKAGVWGPLAEYHRANVVGTQNVIAACRQHRIAKLVYTSSPSVAYAGGDECGIDESVPYPSRYLTHYPRTKAEAERLVLAANDGSLATVSLRPHLIWGPGDNHLLPRLLAKAKAGKLRRVGGGANIVDTTYIDNAVQAHVAALDRLTPQAACAGRAYFIANDQPQPLWSLIDRMLACGDVPPVTRGVSATTAYLAGGLLEVIYGALRISSEPPMTRFVARQLATSHWYDLTAAKRDLGYAPAVTVEEGLVRLRAWLQSKV
ncbi:MAG: NAD-dependent epimerase/dehydratase family protein [Planctomycetaceae bacterium]|nr:NAD-dependent epimerase/dehydratase family protein [Planctomycetaceae bacterium]